MSKHEFEIQGTTFEYTRMKLRQQMKLWGRVAADLGPIIPVLATMQEASESEQLAKLGDLLKSASPILDNAETYLNAFVPHVKVDWDAGGKGVKRVPLKDFEDLALDGRKAALLIVECMKLEFGDFLGGLAGVGE